MIGYETDERSERCADQNNFDRYDGLTNRSISLKCDSSQRFQRCVPISLLSQYRSETKDQAERHLGILAQCIAIVKISVIIENKNVSPETILACQEFSQRPL